MSPCAQDPPLACDCPDDLAEWPAGLWGDVLSRVASDLLRHVRTLLFFFHPKVLLARKGGYLAAVRDWEGFH